MYWEDFVLVSQEPPVLRWCYQPNDGVSKSRCVPSVWWGWGGFLISLREENKC